jgi:hypothetical protein
MPRSLLTQAKQRLDRLTAQQERIAVERASALALVASLTAQRGRSELPRPTEAPIVIPPRRRFSRAELAAAMARGVQGRGA